MCICICINNKIKSYLYIEIENPLLKTCSLAEKH